jgi:hypothetical protein
MRKVLLAFAVAVVACGEAPPSTELPSTVLVQVVVRNTHPSGRLVDLSVRSGEESWALKASAKAGAEVVHGTLYVARGARVTVEATDVTERNRRPHELITQDVVGRGHRCVVTLTQEAPCIAIACG